MSETVYTEAEFCKLAKLSRQTIYNLRIAGKLSFCAVGRRILYTPAHLEELLSNSQQPTTTKKAR